MSGNNVFLWRSPSGDSGAEHTGLTQAKSAPGSPDREYTSERLFAATVSKPAHKFVLKYLKHICLAEPLCLVLHAHWAVV